MCKYWTSSKNMVHLRVNVRNKIKCVAVDARVLLTPMGKMRCSFRRCYCCLVKSNNFTNIVVRADVFRSRNRLHAPAKSPTRQGWNIKESYIILHETVRSEKRRARRSVLVVGTVRRRFGVVRRSRLSGGTNRAAERSQYVVRSERKRAALDVVALWRLCFFF